MSDAFADLPLHDAVLREVRIHWESQRCEIFLSAFVAWPERATPHVLTFTGVTRVVVPSEAPWARSVFINRALQGHDGTYQLEVQSGDVIEIRAEAFTFEPARGPASS